MAESTPTQSPTHTHTHINEHKHKHVYIYKILPSAPPSPLPPNLPLDPLDIKSHFIHLSTSQQTPRTASRFFNTTSNLWILKLRVDTFDQPPSSYGRLVWEPAHPEHRDDNNEHDQELFPHLYDGFLGRGNVDEVLAFERKEGEDWGVVLAGLEP